jgi:hypothetical protein
VKPLWVVVVVACSPTRDEPREVREPAPRGSEARHSIDISVKDAPLSIRGVELTPSPRAPGGFELGYRIEARDKSLQVPARIMCRVGGYNVVYPVGSEPKPVGPRLAALYRPDPFTERAQACEVEFLLGERRIGAACFRDGAIADGACSSETFGPPPRQTTFTVELAHASLELRHGTALVSGLFTLVEPLAPKRKFAAQIRCEDAAGVASGEGELAFLPLDQLRAGTSMYGPVAIFLDRTAAADATCELHVVSRATDNRAPPGAPTEQLHARYCMTTGAVRAGDCSQK